jgi:hypothetical protein
MTTINDVQSDVIAAHMASRLPLGSLNCLMRSSRRFEVICKNDEYVWEPMVRALFLKKQGTHYETVRDFHIKFNAFTDQQLSQPEPVSVFARTANWLNNLWSDQAPPPKKTLFKANIERWRSAQSLCQRVAYIVTSPLNLDLAIAFQLYRIDPSITYQIQFCLAALKKGYLSQVAWFLEKQLIPINEQAYLLMNAGLLHNPLENNS